MKNIFAPLLSILFIITILFTSCGNKETKVDISQMSRAAYYNDLIKDIINVSPPQLGIKLSDSKIIVYGVVMEHNIGDLLMIITAAYSTGEAVDMAYGGSCFVNTGEKGVSSGISELAYINVKRYLKYYESDIEKYWKGKDIETLSQNLLMTLFINEKENKEIRDEIKNFIESAQNNINSLTEVEKDGSLPGPGEIKIIFLTNKGRYFVKGTNNEITGQGSEYAALLKSRSDISDIVFRNFATEK